MLSQLRTSGSQISRRFSNAHKTVLKYGVLGVPFNKGQEKDGVQDGPDAIRDSGLLARIKRPGCEVKDYGNVTYSDVQKFQHNFNMNFFEHVAACTKEVSRRVSSVLQECDVCLTLGGDHSISIGSVDGHIRERGELALLWVDAHADINTADTSYSWNMNGMPLSLLIQELVHYWPKLPLLDWHTHRLPVKNLAYIGLRSVDDYERLLLDKFNITAFSMEDVERLGITNVTALALEKIDPRMELPLHVSFDIDSMDALEVPSTTIPVRGGLHLREGIQLMEAAFRTGRLSAVDLVELNPTIGDQKDRATTIEAALKILQAACGHSRLGNHIRQTEANKLTCYTTTSQ